MEVPKSLLCSSKFHEHTKKNYLQFIDNLDTRSQNVSPSLENVIYTTVQHLYSLVAIFFIKLRLVEIMYIDHKMYMCFLGSTCFQASVS
jgi:hypothetical protein